MISFKLYSNIDFDGKDNTDTINTVLLEKLFENTQTCFPDNESYLFYIARLYNYCNTNTIAIPCTVSARLKPKDSSNTAFETYNFSKRQKTTETGRTEVLRIIPDRVARDLNSGTTIKDWKIAVLFFDEIVIGSCLLHYFKTKQAESFGSKNCCEIEEVCINSMYAGQGYGKILMTYVLAELKNDHNVELIKIYCNPDNAAACSLYYKAFCKDCHEPFLPTTIYKKKPCTIDTDCSSGSLLLTTVKGDIIPFEALEDGKVIFYLVTKKLLEGQSGGKKDKKPRKQMTKDLKYKGSR